MIGAVDHNERVALDKPACIDIDPRGDLVLQLSPETGVRSEYRVCIAALREASGYFDVLLDPAKFREGHAVLESLNRNRGHYEENIRIAYSDLPTITLRDVGQVPKRESSSLAFKCFLDVMHGLRPPLPSPAHKHVATLAVYADRFDAIGVVSAYIAACKWGKNKVNLDGTWREESCRMRLYLSLILGLPHWFYVYSAEMINHGSQAWFGEGSKLDDGAWWYLPHGIEGQSISQGD